MRLLWMRLLVSAMACLPASVLAQDVAQPAESTSQWPTTTWGDPVFEGIWPYDDGYDGRLVIQAMESIEHGSLHEDKVVMGVENVPWPSMVTGTPDGKIPYQPSAVAKRDDRSRNWQNPPSKSYIPTSARCVAFGIPMMMHRRGLRVLQTPTHFIMYLEMPSQLRRTIWMDGRPAPPPDVKLWHGFSRGHWEGHTLVVETTNQNALPWIDNEGNYFSDGAVVLERFQFVTPTEFNYEATVTDPSVYTQPWGMRIKFKRRAPEEDDEPLEVGCAEGNQNPLLRGGKLPD
jgi:hypothetical protein